jgi:predicted ArsR family transcriptional regulator
MRRPAETSPDAPVPQRATATAEQVAALGSAIRLRILRICYSRVLTNKEIAARLGRDPATTLHHIRRLVASGFLVAQPARRGNRGAREIPYQATGLSWRLNWQEDPGRTAVREAMLEAFLGEVVDVGVEQVEQTRLVVALDPAGHAEFRDRLAALLEEFAARPVVETGTREAVYVAMYPGG